MKIKEIAKEIHEVNVNNGFWEDKETKNIGEVLMLCVSELSEALEAHRKDRFADLDAFATFTMFVNNDSGNTMDIAFVEYIKDTFEDELADTVIRIFDLCEGFGIDLETHIRLKLEYNKTRPYKHGKKY